MYNITEQERKTLVNGMVNLFDEYDYEYTFTAIDTIIDKWCTNKATLIEAFKKHPNYVDGKFLISFDVDYEREIDTDIINNFRDWAYGCLCDRKIELPEEAKNEYDYLEVKGAVLTCLYYRVLSYKSRLLDEDTANDINRVFPEMKAREGQKTTRIANKILTYLNFHKHPDYNREFAKYADALTPLTIKRHTILSINPLDYLTMSFGNSWSSCHTIDKHNKRGMPNGYEGQYSSGTMSYLLDGVSMVLYVVDSKYDGNEYYTQPKINRQMFHYGVDKLIQGRLYPQGNDGNGEQYTQYRQVVQSIIAECFGFPNRWVKKSESIYDLTESLGTHYRDYTSFNDCNITIPRDTDNTKIMVIGHEPICIECGAYHEESETINCCHTGYCTCVRCGCQIDTDDAIEIDGEYYCEDCVTFCEDCNEYHLNDDVRYVSSVGRYVCDDCLEEYYRRCDDCDEYYPTDEMYYERINGQYHDVCENCLDEYYRCEDCGDYFSPHNVVEDEDTGDYYCRNCMNQRKANDEEEGE